MGGATPASLGPIRPSAVGSSFGGRTSTSSAAAAASSAPGQGQGQLPAGLSSTFVVRDEDDESEGASDAGSDLYGEEDIPEEDNEDGSFNVHTAE